MEMLAILRRKARTTSAFAVSMAFVGIMAACEKDGPVRSENNQPSGSFTVSPGGPVLMGATEVRLAATGGDADGDALTYSWNFGDGTTGAGQTATHVFSSAGTLTVTLTIQDARGGQTAVSNTVDVRSLTGHWVDADPRFQVDLVQTGSTFTGSVTVNGFGRVSTISAGLVRDPRSVEFHRQSSVVGFATVDYRGTLDLTLDRMDVVAIQTAATSFNLRRQ